MKAAGMFISTILVIDAFLVSFYAGFNSRHVLVVDPSLPPLVPEQTKKADKPVADKKPATTADKTKHGDKSGAKESSAATKGKKFEKKSEKTSKHGQNKKGHS